MVQLSDSTLISTKSGSLLIAVLLSILFLAPVCLFAQSVNKPIADNQNTPLTLDGIEKVPEWLMVQVQQALPSEGLNVWLPTGNFATSSLVRVPRFPEVSDNIVLLEDNAKLYLKAARNEQVSAQLAVTSFDTLTNLRIVSGDLTTGEGFQIKAENIHIRFVKYIPVQKAYTGVDYEQVAAEGVSGFRAPDVVADPIVEMSKLDVPKLRAQPIWFTFQIPEETPPGEYSSIIVIHSDQFEPFRLNLRLKIGKPSIPSPGDYVFDTDIWLNPFSIAAHYDVKVWSKSHWELLGHYFDNLASYGQTKILTTITEQPWKKFWLDGRLRSQTETPYQSMVKWKLTSDKQWQFDYSVFDKYVETALKHNNGPHITAQSMLVFRGDQRITYFDEEAGEQIVEFVKVEDEKFKKVWGVFLKDFRDHLVEKGWFDQILLGFDERPETLMNNVREIIRESVPEFEDKIYLSGHHLDEKMEHLNIGYSALSDHRDSLRYMQILKERLKSGKTTRFYLTCCSGAHPNRFSYSPAVESRLIPWIALKYNLNGYADWAYNSWPINVFTYPVFNYPQGDEYFVYPGKNGPMSSIRWELLKEGIEDYELIYVAKKAGEINSDQIKRIIETATLKYDQAELERKPDNIIKARELLLTPDH